MSNQITGAPKVSVNISTVGAVIARILQGRVLVQAITPRGLPNTPIQVSNEAEFNYHFGKAEHASAKEALRAVRKGVVLVVSRVCHYTDPADKTTLQGDKATASIGTTGNEIDFAAKSIGEGYAGISIAIEEPKSAKANVVDIVITLAGYTPYRKTDVPTILSTELVAALNQELPFVDIVDTTGTLTVASGVLTGGRDAAIVAADIIGSEIAKTGLYAFDSADTSIMRMANLISQTNEVDAAYISYAANTDRTVHLATPIGTTYQNVLDYRNAEGAYSSGSKFNSWNARLVAGGAKVSDPYNPSQTLESSGLADVMAARAKTDSLKGVYQSAMQQPYCLFDNVRGVVSPFSKAQYDTLANNGLLWIENAFGVPQLNNNNTLLIDQTSLLKNEEVADLALYIKRYILLMAQKYKGLPNTPQSVWRPMYREAKQFLNDLVANEALQGGEGDGWIWVGDQFAEKVSDATYNTPADLSASIFKVQLKIKPVLATKYIVIDLSLYAGNVSITEG